LHPFSGRADFTFIRKKRFGTSPGNLVASNPCGVKQVSFFSLFAVLLNGPSLFPQHCHRDLECKADDKLWAMSNKSEHAASGRLANRTTGRSLPLEVQNGLSDNAAGVG
jgi:hypothetical protein